MKDGWSNGWMIKVTREMTDAAGQMDGLTDRGEGRQMNKDAK